MSATPAAVSHSGSRSLARELLRLPRRRTVEHAAAAETRIETTSEPLRRISVARAVTTRSCVTTPDAPSTRRVSRRGAAAGGSGPVISTVAFAIR